MKILKLYMIVVLFLLFITCGYLQNAFADENGALSLVENVKIATNSQDFDALEQMFTNNFTIQITQCNQAPKTQDKNALFESMSGAFSMLEVYKKESEIISTEVVGDGYVIKSDVVENMSLKGRDKSAVIESIETFYIIESGDKLLVDRIIADAKC